MKNSVICNNIDCLESINIDEFDICDTNEDDTLGIVECPYCHHMNAITYYKQIHYQARDITEQDLKDFNY